MPLTRKRREALFGTFAYTEGKGGRIVIDPEWVKENIVSVRLPHLGRVRFHKKGKAALKGVFAELKEEGLLHRIDREDFRKEGGTFVPRHKSWNPRRGLSSHAWGIAIDLNVQENPYGKPPKLDKRIVKVFEKHGFVWGGRWKVPDGMHFELVRLIESEKGVPKRKKPKEHLPSWAKQSIAELESLNILTRFPDATFRPSQKVTRAELAVALARLIRLIRTRQLWE